MVEGERLGGRGDGRGREVEGDLAAFPVVVDCGLYGALHVFTHLVAHFELSRCQQVVKLKQI